MRRFYKIFFMALLLVPAGADAYTKKQTAADLLMREIKIKLTDAPKDQETCFSPDEDCDIKLMKFIQSAQVSIDVAIYDINLPEIVDILDEQSRRIKVRILVDKRQSKGKRSLVPLMIERGLDVRYGRQKGILHDKMTIIDNRMMEIGSYNYTRHATQANNENQFYSANPKVIDRYEAQFQKMWDKAAVIKR